MATRFTYQGKTLTEQDISVYIDDADFVGSSTDFQIENRSVTISHEGDARNRNQAIIPSSCSFSMLIEGATHDAFITDLADAEEERFTVKVTKGTGLGESIVWVGYILPDLSVREDIGYPFPLTIRATDGLGRLKGIDYEDSGAHYGVETFLTHILNCLTKGGLAALYYDASADIFLRTIVNWYDANHSTATDKCPLAYTQVNGKVWSRDNDQGETLFTSCYEVLESIAKGWGARLYYSGGSYRFETINARVNQTLTERRFAYDETLISSAANVNYTKQLSQNTAGARLATGQLTYAPPLKGVKVKYHHNTYANYLYAHNNYWYLGAPTENSFFVANNFSTTSSAKFVVSGRIKLNVVLDAGYMGPWIYVCRVLLRTFDGTTYSYAHQDVEFQQIGGTYTIKKSPADPEWTAASNFLEVSNTQPITSTYGFNGYIDFQYEIGNLVTPTDIEQFEVYVRKHEARRFDGTVLASTVSEFAAKDMVLHVITGDEAEGALTQTTNISNTNTSNSEVVEVETMFGSALQPWTPAKLTTGSDGATWADSLNTWDVISETANVSFSKLLAREIMAGQSTPKEIRTGGMWGEQLHAHSLMKINDDLYIFMGGDNNLVEEVTNGEWVKVGRSTTEINDDGDTEEDPNVDIERVKTPFTFVKGKGHVSIDTNGILALAAITANVTSADIAAGAVTSIPVKYELVGDTWLTGDNILIIGQSTGVVERATLTADASSGDTTLSVSATFENDMGEDSLIVYDLLNKTTLEGGGGGFGGASKWTDGTGGAIYRESKVGIGTGLSSPGARLDVVEASGATPFVFNTYASGSVGTYFNFANTNTAGVNVIAMNEADNVSAIRAGLFRYGSTHSSTPGQLHVRNLLNASLVFATNNTNRITISGTGGVTVHPLAGTGNRLMQISATGVLSRSTIDPNSITTYTFTNGLTLSGTTVRLGGALTQNTMVDGSFAMSFNANKFIVGNTTTTWTAPHVFTNTGATGTTLTSSTLHVAGNGGDQNAKLTLGVGDAYSAGVTHFFNGGSGITRLYNMTASQQIRFAIGSETSDKVVIAPDGIGRLGAGFSSLTGLVCTLQSAGSFGTNIVENTGNYTFGDEDCILIQTGTATSFYTLPAPATVKGRLFFVMNHSSQNTTLSTTVKNSFGAQFGTIDSGHHAIFSSDGTIYRGFRITSL